MSRRRNNEELEFGSDSFLDIIANIVGILIILIVIAGVKVARQPPETPEPASAAIAEPAATNPEPDLLVTQRQRLDVLETESARLQEEISQLTQQKSTLEKKSAEWTEHADNHERSIEDMQSDLNEDRHDRQESQHLLTSIKNESEQLVAATTQLSEKLEAARRSNKRLTLAVQSLEQNQSETTRELHEIEMETRRLKEVLENIPIPDIPDSDRLTHRLSPVAQSTTTQEVHFRLRQGRIAWIPLDALLEQLKDQVRSRGNLIGRFGRYEGVVGPTGGFLMKYTVERLQENPLTSLSGRGSYSVGVSQWILKPSDTLMAEPVDVALQPGSQFRQILEAADPDTTVTVWLYADDFKAFGPLREYAHALGLRVAARPLPDDAEITGSPGGSRSSAQ